MYKRILLNAYLANNLGDDLFIQIICERFREIMFYILETTPYTNSFKSISNIRICSLKDIQSLKFDMQIMIGGSIFMQPRDICNIYSKHKSVKDLRVSLDIPFIVIGANFGPYTQTNHLDLYKNWFSTLNDICFRDKQSYDLFKEFHNIRWAPDVIFNYKMKNITQHSSKSVSISCIYNNQRIGLPEYSQEEYFQKLANISIYYIENGYDIKLADFCTHQGDLLAIYKILKYIPSKLKNRIEILEYNGYNFKKFLSTFLDTEYIIGTRFHSVILGWMANIPVFPIVYNIKTDNVIKSYGFKGNYINIQEIGKCTLEFINKNKKDRCLLECSELIKKSALQFEFLNDFYEINTREVL